MLNEGRKEGGGKKGVMLGEAVTSLLFSQFEPAGDPGRRSSCAEALVAIADLMHAFKEAEQQSPGLCDHMLSRCVQRLQRIETTVDDRT